MKRLSKFVCGAALLGLFAAPVSAAEVEIQAGIFGGTLYQMSYAFTEIVKKHAPMLKFPLLKPTARA